MHLARLTLLRVSCNTRLLAWTAGVRVTASSWARSYQAQSTVIIPLKFHSVFESLGSPICCRKVDTFQGSKLGSCLTLGNWIVQGDTCWQSKRFYWERAPGWRAVGLREPRRTAHVYLIAYCELCQICDLGREFGFRTREEASGTQNFMWQKFYYSEKGKEKLLTSEQGGALSACLVV